jgi:hypothetical protein
MSSFSYSPLQALLKGRTKTRNLRSDALLGADLVEPMPRRTPRKPRQLAHPKVVRK